MKYKAIKKEQRQINKQIKKWNISFNKDSLWKGRFQMRQIARYVHRYEDGSGFCIWYDIAMVDKSSGNYTVVRATQWQIEYGWHFWSQVNDFIIKDVKVWDEIPSPRDKEFVVDYTQKPLKLVNMLDFRVC